MFQHKRHQNWKEKKGVKHNFTVEIARWLTQQSSKYSCKSEYQL